EGSAMHSKSLKYRPDIDGLRAIAVILVLLFHFDLGVGGGFIGVDVFFVISGYLITEVIRKGVLQGTFSFTSFFARRLLRLHPALIVTVAACLAIGYLLFDPASFSNLAKSGQYALFSVSNIYFWINQDYFDPSAHTQPLLHTWSLAAEWQFYLVWPFIVWASLKVSERFFVAVLSLLTAGSLVASQIWLSHDSSAAYFLIPFRVFELSAGALVVYFEHHKKTESQASIIFFIGLALIIMPALLLDSSSPFPGFRAALPCLGAIVCIYSGESTAAAILRMRPVVYVGLISYSVYLVHWPLSVFYKYYMFRDIVFSEKISLLVTSLILGALLHHLIEKRFITKVRSLRIAGYGAIAFTVAGCFYSAKAVINNNGLPQRIPESYRSLMENPAEYHKLNYGGYGFPLEAFLGDKKGEAVAIITGDSFALQYATGLDKALRKDGSYMLGFFRHGCVISGEYTRILNGVPRNDCKATYNNVINALQGNNLPLIISQSWGGYSGQISNRNGENVELKGTSRRDIIIDWLEKIREDIGDRDLYIVGGQPFKSNSLDTASCLMRPSYIHQRCESIISYRKSDSKSEETNSILIEFARKHKKTHFVDVSPSLCSNGSCTPFRDGKILYSDPTHLSKEGSDIASLEIIKSLNKKTWPR
ncbi:TPA: acyltransferase family protein, partial [Pseudomonas aeruginosa]